MTMLDTRLNVNAIRLDGGTQSRAMNSPGVVEDYADLMRAGVRFPAVIVYFDGADYWLADGFHRVLAALAAGIEHLDADVRQGTRRDAVLFACGANADHGLRRTNADKRRAVETLLRDEEWMQWSDREIARRCGVHHDMVGGIRTELTGGFRQSQDARKGADGRTINTSNIGSAKARPSRPQSDPETDEDDDGTPPTQQPPAQPSALSKPIPMTISHLATPEGFADAARRYLTGDERAELRELL